MQPKTVEKQAGEPGGRDERRDPSNLALAPVQSGCDLLLGLLLSLLLALLKSDVVGVLNHFRKGPRMGGQFI